MAASYRRGQLVSFLLTQNNIDVTVRDKEGVDALGWAKRKGNNHIASKIEAFIAKSRVAGTAEGH
jgi:ankyrin repeat protein